MDISVFFLIVILVCAYVVLILVKRGQRPKQNWIVVDGSNVLYWDRDVPNLQSLKYVLGALASEGFVPVVWFDANAGYLIANKYMGPRPLAGALDLPAKNVFVAPKGTPADPLLLSAARKLGARVVTNDKFRDWVDDYPEITEPGFLIWGRMDKDEFGLNWGD